MCESAACICGGVITAITIITITNILALDKGEKKAYFQLSLSEPAALFLGSCFEYLRARNSTQPLYNDTKTCYMKLERNMARFVSSKNRAEVVAADIISNEAAIARRLEGRMDGVKKKLDKVADAISKHPLLKPGG